MPTDSKPTPYSDYPNPDARPVQFFLTAGAPKTGSLVLKKVSEQGTETLTDDVSFSGSALAQAESSGNRLLFVTEPLNDSIHISGTPSITIRASSDKPAVNLSVWMVILPWTTGNNVKINDYLINRGWADLRNYKSLTKSKPLEPGKFYEMTFNLEPDDQIIPSGRQIRAHDLFQRQGIHTLAESRHKADSRPGCNISYDSCCRRNPGHVADDYPLKET